MSWHNKVLETIKTVIKCRQQRGSILIISAMMLPLMLGFLGFAYDFGNVYMHKVRLQNIVDAAALAGGRAYLESQEKPEKRDEPDDRPGWSGWTVGGDPYKLSYSVGDKFSNGKFNIHKAPGSKHPDADAAADDSILKNIKNLGTTVNMDEFSHYALRAEGMSSKLFYRIGLYEQVPLHFLPMLMDRRVQKVRAGAVVLVDDGKGIVPGNTLFDKLFVVNDGVSFKDADGNNLGSQTIVGSEERDKIPKAGGAQIKATFDGEIVYANDFSQIPEGMVDYFYTNEERNYNLGIVDGKQYTNQQHSIDEMNAIPNMGRKAVWDNSILIESNIAGFLNKLSRPHIDLKKNTIQGTLNEFKLDAVSGYKSRDRITNSHYTITNSDEVTDYFQQDTANSNNSKKTFAFCIPRYGTEGTGTQGTGSEGTAAEKDYLGKAYVELDSNTYFSFHTEGYNFTYIKTNPDGTIKYKDGKIVTDSRVCYTYVLDDAGNKIFCFRATKKLGDEKDGQDIYFWFYKKYFNPSTKKYEYITFEVDSMDEVKDGNQTKGYIYYYKDRRDDGTLTDDGTLRYFEIDLVDTAEANRFSQSQRTQVNFNQIKSSNVYHWEQEGETQLTVTVNSAGGEEYDPVYIILTGDTYGTGGESGTGVTVSTGGEGTPTEEIKTKIRIKVTESNQRPVIFCNLTKNEISEFTIKQGKTFKGMIYSPFAKVVNQPEQPTGGSPGSRKFIGNIIAKEIEIQDPNVSWTHKNFVVDDGDLNKISDAEAAAQKARKETAVNEAQNAIATALGKTLAEIQAVWENPDWSGIFEGDTTSTNYIPTIQKFWNTIRQSLWSATGLDMPDWPWKTGGKTTDTEQHHYGIDNNSIATTGEKLHIINFRTEYLIEPYVNPFNYYSLSD